jgi:ATP-dependent RNA helicase RhlE
MVPADYVHRIGRTGRAGVTGTAVSLVCVDEATLLRDIERLLKAPIPSRVIDGFEPNRSIPAQPIRLRSGVHSAPRRHAAAGRAAGPHRPQARFGGRRGRSRRPAGIGR